MHYGWRHAVLPGPPARRGKNWLGKVRLRSTFTLLEPCHCQSPNCSRQEEPTQIKGTIISVIFRQEKTWSLSSKCSIFLLLDETRHMLHRLSLQPRRSRLGVKTLKLHA